MKKTLRKALSLVLCVALLISSFAFLASAVSVNSSMSELRSQWSRGVGPEVGGRSIDYSYYSPKKSDSDTTKYPLCIFMAGAGEGGYEGEELQGNNFPYWSGEETQAQFVNAGGSYLLIARSPDPIYWDTCPIAPLKAAIDDFAEKNPNVDTDRVYVIGWCIGAVGAKRLVTAYPDAFAGVVFSAIRTKISDSDAKAMKNMAVWFLHCTSDSYSVYNMYCAPSWENVKKNTSNPNMVRLTTCSDAPDTGVLYNHVVWNYIAYDCRDSANCVDLKTINGYGEEEENVKAISWLSRWWLGQDHSDVEKACTCQCHSTNAITKLIWSIKCFIYKIFSPSKRTCSCGAMHW